MSKKSSNAKKGVSEEENSKTIKQKARAPPKRSVRIAEDESHNSEKKSRVFILQNVDAGVLDERYGMNSLADSSIPENVTKLSDLAAQKHDVITFLDDSKKTRVGTLFMVDVNNINLSGQYHCFWDSHPIGRVKPIGCPLEFVFNQAVRKYVSEISKNSYIIRESLSSNKVQKVQLEGVEIVEGNFYRTDGVFCSFNCCMAFIYDNKHNPIYKNSEQLLYKMYHDFFGKNIEKIKPANHWRTLLVKGGKDTIEKFRNNLDSVEYNYQGTVRMRPIAHVYEEKYKL